MEDWARAGEPNQAEAEAEWETRWTSLPCSPAPALPPSAKVQAYISMFLLRELASPVGNATGIRDEKETWKVSWRNILETQADILYRYTLFNTMLTSVVKFISSVIKMPFG